MSGSAAASLIEGRRVAVGATVPGEFTYCVTEISRSGGSERRADRRVRTRLHEGTVAGPGALNCVDCRILNQSRSGLRLQLVKDYALPKRFRMTDTAAAVSFEVRLMWQNGLTAGVQILARRTERVGKAAR